MLLNPLVDSLYKRSKIKDYIKNKLDVDAQLYNQIELSTNLDEPKKAKYKKEEMSQYSKMEGGYIDKFYFYLISFFIQLNFY